MFSLGVVLRGQSGKVSQISSLRDEDSMKDDPDLGRLAGHISLERPNPVFDTLYNASSK